MAPRALCNCLSFTHSHTHSHTSGGCRHARRWPTLLGRIIRKHKKEESEEGRRSRRRRKTNTGWKQREHTVAAVGHSALLFFLLRSKQFLCSAFSRHIDSSAHHGHIDVVVVRQRVQHLHHGRLHQPECEAADAAAPAGEERERGDGGRGHDEDQFQPDSHCLDFTHSSHTRGHGGGGQLPSHQQVALAPFALRRQRSEVGARSCVILTRPR